MLKSDACILFGATGDLSLRMLLPSLFHLEADSKLPPDLRIVGVARQGLTTDEFNARVLNALEQRVDRDAFKPETWRRLAARIDYCPADVTSEAEGARLVESLQGASSPLFYFATSPTLYSPICEQLHRIGLAGPSARVVLEKPIGRDLASSLAINEAVGRVFDERRVFRIDHYLGKETVQNLLALRFANSLFEPLWNNRTIDHVQITVAETEGVGERWRYYDDYGAARDMLQNHMLQLLALVAMEPPSDMNPNAVRNEKVKVLRSLRRMTAETVGEASVRGQYTAGAMAGSPVPAYREERGQPSATETFLAVRAEIDNWRWAGVPFFLRTGKRLPHRRTLIVVHFKPVPHSIFGPGSDGRLVANRLIIDLQPQENIELMLMNKAPGVHEMGMDLQPLSLSLSLRNAFGGGEGTRRRIAYERLMLDAINGLQTLFVSRDEIEEAWSWIGGVAKAWDEAGVAPIPYAAGTWGPAKARQFIEASGRRWDD